MATKKISARGFIFQAASGASWVGIAGLKTFTVNYGDHDVHVDATDFDSAGQYEEVVLQRGASLKLEGTRRRDPATGLADAGQAVLDTLAQGLSDSSIGQIRFRYSTEVQWRVWNVTAKATEEGGGTNELGKWGMELARTGAETTTSAP